ncbi:hypothetical protein [Mangrovibacillus cuniculi]|uniref:DUF2834 domain-containing protein n=1 Tax=Mangrovibacillus cuniculi TaxID=2593652 RepID=A0A7S8CAW6_9BACI|nr:hypothetical protein [Mangrovibacillus cuniculi]QPC46572.1 hypothetical protein G8O30_06120 [Mangrovibacillus cuniculi]
MKYLLVWIALVCYSFFFAPGEEKDLVLQSLFNGNWANVDPFVLMIFSFLGLFPMIFLFILYQENSTRLPKWPFAFGAFFLGAFSLLPYFFLKDRFSEKHSGKQTVWPRNTLLLTLLLLLFFLILVSGIGGSLSRYQEAFMQSKLVSVMTIDFLVLVWLSADRLLTRKASFCITPYLSFIPVVGPIVVLLSTKKDVK